MNLNFGNRTKGMLYLDSWLETNKLEDNSRIEKVCQKGFEFPQGGLLFPTGYIKLTDTNMGKKTYEMLNLKLAVGRSYCVPA